MTIDGRAVDATNRFGVVDPSTGEQFASAPACPPESLDAALHAASAAQPAWAGDPAGRQAALNDFATALAARADDLARILTTEQGKPLNQAYAEIHGGIAIVREFAELETPATIVADTTELHSRVLRRPVGVIGAITPWNFPFSIAMLKAAAALACGNTVVLKPSPFTPLTTLRAGELSRDVLPPGVLNVVSGNDQLGASLVGHPIPRGITFTGSVEAGKAIAVSAGRDLKRLTLELGGNDAAIVLQDANPASVATQIGEIAFRNCGQICATIKRLYVHESLYTDVVDALTEYARTLHVDGGFVDGVQMGPVQNEVQRKRVVNLVVDAIDCGATVAAGGRQLDRPGFFYAPTILTDLAEGVRIVDEEQFGPALPVLSFRSDQEAVKRANSTVYGLTASLWGTDCEYMETLAGQLEAGVVNVNTHDLQTPGAPFGGHKWSGLGAEGGHYSVQGLTNAQVINVVPPHREL